MKKNSRLIVVLSFLLGTTAALYAETPLQPAKQYQKNPYSSSYSITDVRSFGTFYVEYNPHTWQYEYDFSPKYDKDFHGVSLGFSYFVPVLGSLGFDAGLKAQYLFHSEKQAGLKHKVNMFSTRLPVDIVYDLRLFHGQLAIDPFGGVYARFNFSAKDIEEYSGERRRSVNMFNDKQTDYYDLNPFKRFQLGWQAGVNLRLGRVLTVGGAYWHDFGEVSHHTSVGGFNARLGVNF